MVDTLREHIDRILEDDDLDFSSESTKAESIEALIPVHSWESVLAQMLELLRKYRRAEDWRTAAEVMWGAVLDGREMPADEVIAHLYYGLPEGDDDWNLAWSVTIKLKRMGYLSSYDPLGDPMIAAEMEKLKHRHD